jgi:hypothetical protein
LGLLVLKSCRKGLVAYELQAVLARQHQPPIAMDFMLLRMMDQVEEGEEENAAQRRAYRRRTALLPEEGSFQAYVDLGGKTKERSQDPTSCTPSSLSFTMDEALHVR